MQLPRTYRMRLADERKLKEAEAQDGRWVLPVDAIRFTPPYLEKAGIFLTTSTLGNGFLKFSYQDFIVEELTLEGGVVSIAPENGAVKTPETAKIPKVKADLVKQGLSTFEALELLAEHLSLPLTDMYHAGLKDSRAITAQEIIINNCVPEQLAHVSIPNLFLKNIRPTNTVFTRGNLAGNRFTIHVRCPGVSAQAVQSRLDSLVADGFWNFFSLQRFGSRLLSHDYGRLVLQQKYEEAVKLFLTGESAHEMRVLQHFRREAKAMYGQWQNMDDIFAIFPYFYHTERTVLASLKEKPNDFAAALTSVQDQTTFWVYAYFSYAFNLLLSHAITQGDVSAELPLLRHDDLLKERYRTVLPEEEIQSIRYKHPELPFLNLYRQQTLPTRIKPTMRDVKATEMGQVFHFDLGKGAYATTFLSQLFDLYQGRPVPAWVPDGDVETRALLGYAPVSATQIHFPKSDTEVGASDFD